MSRMDKAKNEPHFIYFIYFYLIHFYSAISIYSFHPFPFIYFIHLKWSKLFHPFQTGMNEMVSNEPSKRSLNHLIYSTYQLRLRLYGLLLISLSLQRPPGRFHVSLNKPLHRSCMVKKTKQILMSTYIYIYIYKFIRDPTIF